MKSSDEAKGSKRSMASIMKFLEDRNMDSNAVWNTICDIIIKTLLAIQPRLASSYRNFFGQDVTKGRVNGPACFEILGFDIMIDDQVWN